MCLHCAPTERDKLLMLQAINILLLRSKEQCNPLEQRQCKPMDQRNCCPFRSKARYSNFSKNLTSFSKSSRMSSSSYISAHMRSIPNPKANPENSSGSTPTARSTFG